MIRRQPETGSHSPETRQHAQPVQSPFQAANRGQQPRRTGAIKHLVVRRKCEHRAALGRDLKTRAANHAEQRSVVKPFVDAHKRRGLRVVGRIAPHRQIGFFIELHVFFGFNARRDQAQQPHRQIRQRCGARGCHNHGSRVFDHAPHFAQRVGRIEQMFQHFAAHDQVKFPVGERQLLCVAGLQHDVLTPEMCLHTPRKIQHHRRNIYADDPAGPLRQIETEQPCAAADFQHRAVGGEGRQHLVHSFQAAREGVARARVVGKKT